MSHTFKYKSGYIHVMYRNGQETVLCQVDAFAYALQAKSVQAAKIRITKHIHKAMQGE